MINIFHFISKFSHFGKKIKFQTQIKKRAPRGLLHLNLTTLFILE